MALFSFERTSSPKAACAQQQRPTSPSSNTTATSTDSTTSSYKRAFTSSDSSSSIPELPPTVAWLEHTTLDMSATVSKSFANCSTEFTLKVTYFDAAIQQSALTWRVNRSFDEYVEFQQRLLKTLALGHACSAECRWLHSFVKNYFPKKARFFGNCSTRTTNVRREKLARCLSVLKASLLNRGNHGCAIVALQLAGEFDTFIHGNNRFAAITADVVRRRSRAGSMLSVDDDCDSDQLEKLRRHSVSSNASSTSTDAADHEQQHIADLVNVCDLCDNSLDEAPDTSLATLNAIVNSRSSSRSIDSVDSSVVSNVFSCHTTTLSCGHQFHDECVLPELAALGYCCPSCNAPQNV